MNVRKAIVVSGVLVVLGGAVWADDAYADDGIDRGDRIEDRLDRKGDRIEDRLDEKGDRRTAGNVEAGLDSFDTLSDHRARNQGEKEAVPSAHAGRRSISPCRACDTV